MKNNKLVIRKLFLKSVLKNELSCMKIHGFQAKWSILWPHSWHSLFKWSHIVHNGAYWNSKQCFLREFSFSLNGKFNFHFPSARIEFFLWRACHIFVAKLDQNIFSKILGHIWFTIDQMVGCEKPWSTSREKDKFLPIQLEAGQIWTAAAS